MGARLNGSWKQAHKSPSPNTSAVMPVLEKIAFAISALALAGLFLLGMVSIQQRLESAAKEIEQQEIEASQPQTIEHDGHLWVVRENAIAHHPDCPCGR